MLTFCTFIITTYSLTVVGLLSILYSISKPKVPKDQLLIEAENEVELLLNPNFKTQAPPIKIPKTPNGPQHAPWSKLLKSKGWWYSPWHLGWINKDKNKIETKFLEKIYKT